MPDESNSPCDDLNPYASPGAIPQVGAPTHYRIDSRRVTIREYWRLSAGPVSFAIMVLMKSLHVRLPIVGGIPFPVKLVRLADAELSARAAEVLGPFVAQWEQLGLQLAFCYRIPVVGDRETCVVALRSADGKLMANAVWDRSGRNFEQTYTGCASVLPDGGVWGVSSSDRHLDRSPRFHTIVLTGHSPAELLARHVEQLQELRTEPISLTEERLPGLMEELLNLDLEYHIRRGTFVPMTPDEVAAASAAASAGSTGRALRRWADRPLPPPTLWFWALVPLRMALPLVLLSAMILVRDTSATMMVLLGLLVLLVDEGFVRNLARRSMVGHGWNAFRLWGAIVLGQTAAAWCIVQVAKWLAGL